MTRIVGGTAKGRRLVVPDRGTRPTSERAREALFSSLNALVDLNGARVLDLFAGSGAVGLEALSRGAASAALVESERSTCDIIQRNIAVVGLAGATLHRSQAATYLAGVGTDEPFDFVFADPPYAFEEQQLEALLQQLCTPRWLAAEAIVVVERARRGAAPVWPETIDVIKNKRYGEGVLWYGRGR